MRSRLLTAAAFCLLAPITLMWAGKQLTIMGSGSDAYQLGGRLLPLLWLMAAVLLAFDIVFRLWRRVATWSDGRRTSVGLWLKRIAVVTLGTSVLWAGSSALYYQPLATLRSIRQSALRGDAVELDRLMDRAALSKALSAQFWTETRAWRPRAEHAAPELIDAIVVSLLHEAVSPKALQAFFSTRHGFFGCWDMALMLQAFHDPKASLSFRYVGLNEAEVSLPASRRNYSVTLLLRRTGLTSWRAVDVRLPATCTATPWVSH